MKLRIPPDYMPSLDIEKLPEDERANARILERQIMLMEDFANDVEAAVELFHTCRVQMTRGSSMEHMQTLHRWMIIACRAGAIDLYQFGMSMQTANGLILKCPTLDAKVDRASLKKARKLFETQFPSFEKLRHSVAHEWELAKSQEAIKKNALKESVEIAPFIQISANGEGVPMGNIINDTFTNTIAGQIVSYDLNDATVKAVRDAQDAFKAAFGQAPTPSV